VSGGNFLFNKPLVSASSCASTKIILYSNIFSKLVSGSVTDSNKDFTAYSFFNVTSHFYASVLFNSEHIFYATSWPDS